MDHQKFSNAEENLQFFSKCFTLLFQCDGKYAKTQIERQRVPIYEAVNKHLHDMHFVLTGSAVEGAFQLNSDVDQMNISRNMTAVFDTNSVNDNKCTFEIRMGENQSCYVKLALCICSDELEQQGIMECVNDVNGELYLSSEKYRKLRILPDTSTYRSSYASTSEYYEHGPCASSTLIFESNSIEVDIDRTEGIQCSSPATVADEWLTRDRKTWPPKNLLDKAANLPVFVVPVGNPNSRCSALEWRLSFISFERELVWHFDEIQFYCFYIMKCINKCYLEPLAQDVLSTYHVKTITFWLFEKCLLETKQENLIHLILAGLEMLKEAITKKELKHYINTHHNLFHNKFENSDLRKTLAKKIEDIMDNIIPIMLLCKYPLKEESKEKILALETGENLPKLVVLTDDEKEENERNERFLRYYAVYDIMLSMLRNPITGAKLVELQEVLQELVTELNAEVILMVTLFSYIRLGMLYHLDYVNITDPSPLYFDGGKFESDCINPSDPNEKVVRLQAAKMSFDLGSKLDQISGALYKAMFFFVQNDLDQMLEVMDELLDRNILLRYEGVCSSYHSVKISDGEIVQTNETAKILTKEIPGPVCFDVILIGDDVRCVPDAIKYDCELNDYFDRGFYFLYHPVVFSYYLSFEMHHKLGNTEEQHLTLKHLADNVERIKKDNEGHKALNLLGYCYNKAGRTDEAFMAFKDSLLIKNNAQNAAAYHLCLMALHHIAVPRNIKHTKNVCDNIVS